MEERDKGKSNERWDAAITNLTEISGNLESLQKLLLKKAVFVDEDTFSKASLASQQARTIKLIMFLEELYIDDNFSHFSVQVLEQRVENLERELDSSITAAAHARSEKRQAEAAQKAAELRTQEITKELENTSKVFELHMQELRAKQEEINKRDEDIKLLEAIIQTLGGKSPIKRTPRNSS
ncbi:Light-independent protochlorophyllide reductase subunit N [Bienertia sinuspersici]